LLRFLSGPRVIAKPQAIALRRWFNLVTLASLAKDLTFVRFLAGRL
jgi:hypothetical protein